MLINNIPCKLVARKGKKAEIEIEGQAIVVPSEYIPAAVLEGETMEFCFLSSKDAKIKQDDIAKLILEEILNGK